MLSLITLDGVSKSYKGQTLFEQVNLTIDEGKAYGIIGPNGSGKSVLFKMICGFIFPDQGTITVQGKEIGKSGRFPDNFGVIIDRPGYLPNKTGYQNLVELASIRGEIGSEDIKKAMSAVGLSDKLTQKVKYYSLGMKQKLALAQAIMEHPQVLILDEPFNALDADSVQTVREILLDFKKAGKTILMTSHHQEDIDAICDDVYRINNTRIEHVEQINV